MRKSRTLDCKPLTFKDLRSPCVRPVVAPGAIGGDVDALLAARAGGHQGAVDVEHGLIEERGRLLSPERDPGLIEDVLEGLDVVGGEAAAEVAAVVGSGMRSAPRASRKTTSLRRSAISSRPVPLLRALEAKLRTWSDSWSGRGNLSKWS